VASFHEALGLLRGVRARTTTIVSETCVFLAVLQSLWVGPWVRCCHSMTVASGETVGAVLL